MRTRVPSRRHLQQRDRLVPMTPPPDHQLLLREVNNPMLAADHLPHAVNGVLNPRATRLPDVSVLLLRVENLRATPLRRMARSDDGAPGRRFEPQPFLAPDPVRYLRRPGAPGPSLDVATRARGVGARLPGLRASRARRVAGAAARNPRGAAAWPCYAFGGQGRRPVAAPVRGQCGKWQR